MKNSKNPAAKNYLSNSVFLEIWKDAISKDELTPELTNCFITLAERSVRHRFYVGYSFREDLIQEALVVLIQNWKKFNPEKTSNIFSYFTTACFRAFQSKCRSEYDLTLLKESLKQEIGAPASFNYSADFKSEDNLI